MSGLYMDGARWERDSQSIVDCRPGQRYYAMPPIGFLPKQVGHRQGHCRVTTVATTMRDPAVCDGDVTTDVAVLSVRCRATSRYARAVVAVRSLDLSMVRKSS